MKITKVFDTKTSGLQGTFDIVYNCGAGDQTVSLAAGASTTVGPFATGTSCTVSEPTLPVALKGWTFGTPVISPEQPVTIGNYTTVEVTVTNSITRNYNKDLTVTKTAVPTFTRTFTWSITKDVDGTQKYTAGCGPATFNYTVNVTHDTGTDTGFVVSGVITVANSNDFDIEGVNITDTIDNGGTCTVTDGTNVTVPATSSVDRNYSCTFVGNPGSGTNTAKAEWDALTDLHLGVVTALAVAAHEIPQEVGDFAILLHSGFSRARALAYNVLASLTTVVGGVLAYFSLSLAQQALPYVLAVAASSFIYIAVADLIPGLHKRLEPRATCQQVVQIVVGVLTIYITHQSLH